MSETAQVKATHASPQQRELPSGWRWVRLGEVCEIIAGQSPPGSTYRTTAEGLPFFQGKVDFGLLNPVPRVWCVEPNKIALPGDILISVRAPVGPTNVADVKCCIGRGLAAIRCGGNTDSDFILSALRHFENKLIQKGSGSTFEAISRNDLEKLAIPLPSLVEQRRIAGVLHEQMAAVEKARTAAQARLEAVKSLPAAFLRQVFPQPGQPLPTGWRWVKLGEVCKVQSGYAFNSEHYVQQGIPIIRISNLIEGMVTLSADTVYVSKEMHVGLEQFMLRQGDLLIAMSGATTGKLGKINSSVLPAYLNQRVGRFIPIGDSLDTSFLGYLLSQPGYLIGIFENAFGCAIPNVSPRFIESVAIPLAPIDEQWRITAELREQMASVEIIRTAAEEELKAINALPAAFLRRAFSGKL